MTPLKVLVVDHHAIHLPGRALYNELGKTEGYEVKVIVPRTWTEQGITYYFTRGITSAPAEMSSQAGGRDPNVVSSFLFFGGKTHRNIYVRLVRELWYFSPDILLVNSEPEGFLAFQAAFLCGLFRRKTAVVFTTWRNMSYGGPGLPFPVKWSWLCKAIERYVLARAAHGIAHSPSAVRVLRLRGYDNMSYIPPWVDTHRFAGVPRPGHLSVEETGQETETGRQRSNLMRIGFVGRLAREKGVDILVSALQAAGFPFSLMIVGDGPEKENLKRLLEKCGLAERTVFLLPVRQDKIPEIMRRLDILVHPSRERPGWKEQFGRVLIEAMAGGVVVVGSNSGDIPSVIGDAGFVFKEDDIVGLRGILDRLAGDENLRREYREAGLRRVTNEYSLNVAVDRYRALFDALKFKREFRTIEKGPSQQNQV